MKREGEETDRERKRKAVKEELEQTEKKKKKLDSTVTDLERGADQLALDAEKQNKMCMLVKSNALRSKAKKKGLNWKLRSKRLKT